MPSIGRHADRRIALIDETTTNDQGEISLNHVHTNRRLSSHWEPHYWKEMCNHANVLADSTKQSSLQVLGVLSDHSKRVEDVILAKKPGKMPQIGPRNGDLFPGAISRDDLARARS